jgi:hypothetical protein
MAVRLLSEFKDFDGITWKIEIADSQYFGSPNTYITSAENGGIEFSRKMENDQPFFCPIVSTTANLSMFCQAGDAVDTFIAGLPNGLENQYQCIIYRNGVIYFIGMVLTDGVQWLDNTPTTVQITVTDGLMRLDEIPFEFAITATDGQYTLGRYIYEALKYCNIEQFYGTSATYIKSCIAWKASEQRINYDVLTDARIPLISFIDDPETNEPVTALEAIRICLKAIGANIRFDDGCWFISQFSNFNYTLVLTFSYTKGTTWGTSVPTVGSYDPRFTVPAGAISEGLMHGYKPSIRYARATWNIESKLIIRKYARYQPYDPVYAKQAISGNTKEIANFTAGSTKFSFAISYSNRLVNYHLNGTNPKNLEVGINININLDNNWYLWLNPQNKLVWVQDATKFIFYNSICEIRYIPWADGYAAKVETGSFVFPPPPSGSYTQLNFSMYADFRNGLYRNGNMAFYGSGTFAQLFGDDNQEKGDVTFQSANNTPNAASIEIEEEIKMGTVPVDWVNGRIQVYNGSAWVNATKFYDSLEVMPTNEYLPQLLCIKTVEYQKFARETIEGEMLLQNYNTTKCLVWSSGRKWVFLEGSYRVNDGMWEGVWMNVLRQDTGFANASANPVRDRFRRYSEGIGSSVNDIGNSVSDIYEQIGNIKKDIEQLKNVANQGVDGYLLKMVDGLPTATDDGVKYTLVAKAGTGTSAPFTLEWKAP